MQELIKTVDTTGEIISFGAVITIEGILVVFAILILIMLVIQAMSLFSGSKPKKAKKANTQTNLVDKKNEETLVQNNESAIDENELIAVLTAAVAACMGTSGASVNIRSYKKISSAWGNAAKREVLDNRF